MKSDGGFVVGDVLRHPAYGGGFRVYKVVGVHLGAVRQESTYRLRVLDVSAPDDGPIVVPCVILEQSPHIERV